MSFLWIENLLLTLKDTEGTLQRSRHSESMSLLMKLFCNLTPDPGVTAVLVFYVCFLKLRSLSLTPSICCFVTHDMFKQRLQQIINITEQTPLSVRDLNVHKL